MNTVWLDDGTNWSSNSFVSGGPERVHEGRVDETFVRRPVGFVLPKPVDKEPITWNGDNA